MVCLAFFLFMVRGDGFEPPPYSPKLHALPSELSPDMGAKDAPVLLK